MGMFDYVQCDARLPVKRDSYARCHLNPFQSKSVRLWEDDRFSERAYDNGCVIIRIGADRRLYDPDGNILEWSGDLVFYSGDRRYPNFVARCASGRVMSIEKQRT